MVTPTQNHFLSGFNRQPPTLTSPGTYHDPAPCCGHPPERPQSHDPPRLPRETRRYLEGNAQKLVSESTAPAPTTSTSFPRHLVVLVFIFSLQLSTLPSLSKKYLTGTLPRVSTSCSVQRCSLPSCCLFFPRYPLYPTSALTPVKMSSNVFVELKTPITGPFKQPTGL